MAKKNQESLADRVAKRAFFLLGLHCVIFFMALREEEHEAVLRLVMLLLYGLCILNMDRILYRLKNTEALRFMRWYWAASSVCMVFWMIWGERWLSSSNDFFKLLFSCMIVPYCHIFLMNYQGWPWENSALDSSLGTAAVLLMCLAHLAYYCWLGWRMRKGKENGPVDL